MNKSKYVIRSIGIILKKLFLFFGITLTWRGVAVIGAVCLVLFSLCVIALELLPSRLLVKTTFVATLETQSLAVRLAGNNGVISGVSGSSISFHDLGAKPSDVNTQNDDLTQLAEFDAAEPNTQRIFSKASVDSRLELDSFVVPAGRAIELSSSGSGQFLSLQLTEEDGAKSADVTVVWKGRITTGANAEPVLQQIGSERVSMHAPLIEIDASRIDSSIYSPMDVVGISTDRLRLNGSNQIATSSVLSGDIQFYFGSYPIEPIVLRSGEFTKFSGLTAQFTNLTLTENGMRFVLVGEADTVEVGFLENLRDIHPSLLVGFLSVQSLVIISSAIFALILAVLSAVTIGKPD